MDNSFLVICLDRDKTHSLSPLYNSQKTPNSKQKEISEKIDYIGGNKTHSIKSNSNEYAERLCKLINLYYDKYEFEEKHLVLVHSNQEKETTSKIEKWLKMNFKNVNLTTIQMNSSSGLLSLTNGSLTKSENKPASEDFHSNTFIALKISIMVEELKEKIKLKNMKNVSKFVSVRFADLAKRDFNFELINLVNSHYKFRLHNFGFVFFKNSDHSVLVDKQINPFRTASEMPKETQLVVKDMKQYISSFKNAFKKPKNEITDFWVRKSKQLVLCVILTWDKNSGYRFERGANLEVSLPAGAICAERNAISSAFSKNPLLKRKDFRRIAVCSVTLEKGKGENNPVLPCGVCREWIVKICFNNENFRLVNFESSDCERVRENL